MDTRPTEGKLNVEGDHPPCGSSRSTSETGSAGSIHLGCAGCRGFDKCVSQGATSDNPTGWAVQPGGSGGEGDESVGEKILNEAIPHLSDEPISVDRPILEQLKTNLDISVKPSKREVIITDGFKF